MAVLSLALAALVGISIGLLGGGGSILTVPILSYVAGMGAHEAVSASLVVVGAASAVSTFAHARAGRVRWSTGLIVGASGVVASFAISLLSQYLPEAVVMGLFAVLMISAATAMLRSHGRSARERQAPRVRPWLLLLIGLGVGTVTGLVGAGAGFLIVPALTLLGRLPVRVAVGTSVLVISMNSATGLAGHLLSTPLDWSFVLTFTGIAVAGSFAGSALTGKLRERTVQRTFGVFVLLLGVLVLAVEAVSW